MNTKRYYITTPLYSVNGRPHLGHAYTALAADVLARHLRARDIPVFLQTGTGEHGAGVEKLAGESGLEPKAWCDRASADFRSLWKTLNIKHDNFIRTTGAAHEACVQAAFEKLVAGGDIYRGACDGLYCEDCGAFYAGSELKGNNCPVHLRPAQRVSGERYLFRLSKYAEPLLEHYRGCPDFLSPRCRAQELIAAVKAGLRDIPVSRSGTAWGVPVRSAPAHTVCAWFDALLGYATGPGYNPGADSPDFPTLWPADLRIAGKDGLRAHGAVWPALLMALGLELPRKVYAHGWWTINGSKMSTLRGNYIKAEDLVQDYGVDALRYFIFRELAFGSDGNFSSEAFHRRYNSDLANDLGSLFALVMDLSAKHLDNRLPERPENSAAFGELSSWTPDLYRSMEALQFAEALEKIWQGIGLLNRLVDKKKPRLMARTAPEALTPFLHELIWCLRLIAGWLDPFMPDTASRMHLQLGVGKTSPGGAEPQQVPPLFPRK